MPSTAYPNIDRVLRTIWATGVKAQFAVRMSNDRSDIWYAYIRHWSTDPTVEGCGYSIEAAIEALDFALRNRP